MDNRDEVKAFLSFLSSRRAKITPEQAGLHHYNHNRRVPGLRRSEVADLAGVSVEYYAQHGVRGVQLRGADPGPIEPVQCVVVAPSGWDKTRLLAEWARLTVEAVRCLAHRPGDGRRSRPRSSAAVTAAVRSSTPSLAKTWTR